MVGNKEVDPNIMKEGEFEDLLNNSNLKAELNDANERVMKYNKLGKVDKIKKDTPLFKEIIGELKDE